MNPEAQRSYLQPPIILKVVAYLISQKADLNKKDIDGHTPLQKAEELKYKDIALMLRKGGPKG